MNQYTYKILLSSLFSMVINFSGNLHSQVVEVVKDLQLWSGITIEKEIFSDFEMSFEQEYRFRKNISEFFESHMDIGCNFKLNKYLKLGADYRFIIHRKLTERYENLHRLSIDLSVKKKIGSFRLLDQSRYQNKDDTFLQYNSDFSPVNTIRNKFQVDYSMKNKVFNFFVSEELFYKFKKQSNYFSKLRITIGSETEVIKNYAIGIFYRIDHELKSVYHENFYILGLNATIKI